MQKVDKNYQKLKKKLPITDKKGGSHCIGAIIRTGHEIQCLPYAGFLYVVFHFSVLQLSIVILSGVVLQYSVAKKGIILPGSLVLECHFTIEFFYYSAVQCGSAELDYLLLQYSAVQYVPDGTTLPGEECEPIWHTVLLHSTIGHTVLLYSTIWHTVLLHSTIWHSVLLHSTI